ncbi:MAG TPA: GNAT family protein [Anaerolineales bacterium]|nr:GNAT family protein [Anaerolineales bacterium]
MIYGDHIRLRRDERSDIPKFAEWLNDPEVRRYLLSDLPISQANEEEWFEKMLGLPAEEQPFGIELRMSEPGVENDQWRLIGNCSFMKIDWKARSAEVGLFIGDKSCWNKGYGTEVMRLLLQVGFGTLNLNRIFLRVDEANKGGLRAYEKAGFVHEGRLRQGNYKNGDYSDVLLMSVLRSEWYQNKNDR